MFNSKKIAELEARIKELEELAVQIDNLDTEVFDLRESLFGFRKGCFIGSRKTIGRIPAIEEFLGIEWQEGTPGYKKKNQGPFCYTGDPVGIPTLCSTSSNGSDSNIKPKKCPKK